MSFGEILKGIERMVPRKRRSVLEQWLQNDLEQYFEDRLLSVTKSIAVRWGVLSARALDNGRPLTVVDGLLAATAIGHDLTMVTRNVKHFDGLGIHILNPWDQLL